MSTLFPLIFTIFVFAFIGMAIKNALKVFMSFFKGDMSSLPAPFNNLFQDKNKDGMPDILSEALKASNLPTAGTPNIHVKKQLYFVNGQQYENLDQIPEPQRSLIQKKLPHIYPNNTPTFTTPLKPSTPFQTVGMPQSSGDDIRKVIVIVALVFLIGWLAYYFFTK